MKRLASAGALLVMLAAGQPAHAVPGDATSETTGPSSADSAAAVGGHAKVSRPGEYSGYTKARYDGHHRTSQYVAMRDGTKLAVDIYRPTEDGKVVTKPLPVVWENTAYNRRPTEGQDLPDEIELVPYGYVVARVDQRGAYASYGSTVTARRGQWQPEAYWDAYDMTEWFADQRWSDGKVGMWGCSATGHTQWQAAATQAPHLKAIFPKCAPSEYYDINGVTATAPMDPPTYPAASWPSNEANAAPVDEDTTGEMLDEAREEHRWNAEAGIMPFRDSPSPWMAELLDRPGVKIHELVNTFTHFPEIEASGIPYYQTTNYGEDYRVKSGVIAKLNTLSNPGKTILSLGNHCVYSSYGTVEPTNNLNIVAEERRWFDYWLKGVRNGIMDEPPIYYATVNGSETGEDWQFAYQWPLPNTTTDRYYLGEPDDDAFHSGVNHGTLTDISPTSADAGDDYTVDYGVTSSNRDERGMTFTTEALTTDTEMSGNPIINLWLSSTAEDADVLAFIYDVDEDGVATQIPGTEDGQLRASLRQLNDAPYDNSGLPYHRAYEEDYEPLTPGEPAELRFDLATLSYNFKAGHRIRLVFSNVAVPRPNAPQITPELDPAPVVTYHRSAEHPSYVEFPVAAPVEAKVQRVRQRTHGTEVTLTFPSTMDERYLDDLKPTTISAGNVRATSVRVRGHELHAVFPGNVATGSKLSVTGEFGQKYDYGGMSFVANR